MSLSEYFALQAVKAMRNRLDQLAKGLDNDTILALAPDIRAHVIKELTRNLQLK